MASFAGFPAGKVRMTPIPATLFSELLPEIDDLGELKVTLYALWILNRQEGTIRYFTFQDCMEDIRLLSAFGRSEEAARKALVDAFERAVARGSLLKVSVEDAAASGPVFFLNSPRGRAAVEALQKGEWRLGEKDRAELSLQSERPNIFILYEENIGPLTPMMVETLREAEKEYPLE